MSETPAGTAAPPPSDPAKALDLLDRFAIPFSAAAPAGSIRVSTLLLLARTHDEQIVLYFGRRAARADFRALARRLRFSHLTLARRTDVRDVFEQRLPTLSPLSLFRCKVFPVVIAAALMRAPALGFRLGHGRHVWLAPSALRLLIRRMGFSLTPFP